MNELGIEIICALAIAGFVLGLINLFVREKNDIPIRHHAKK
jgi:hypothetical protein